MEEQILVSKGHILLLIRDSLINYKLISGLNSLGLDADDYNLYLGDALLFLIGFESNEKKEKVFEEIYLPLAEKVRKIDFSISTTKLDALTLEIFNELMDAKNSLSKQGEQTE